MSTLWKRALATTTIALVAGLGLTACGTGGNDTTGTDKGGQSQTETASGTMTADDFVQRINDAQYEAGSSHFVQTMDVQGQKIETSGDLVVDEDPSKVKMTMTMAGGIEMRMVDGELYLNMGEVTGGKFYQAPKDGSNPMVEQLNSSVGQANIGQQLEAFKTALKDFKAEEGAETIDGVETTKYTLTLDTEKLFEAQKTEVPEGADIGDTIEYEMFVGPDDLPRRLVMDIAGTAMNMEFSNWGEDVTVEAPPADQITDTLPGA
ncbi:DUF6612 family protein [Microbacterium sp. NPDC058345]|uniref:DUF6612 family protein n=1 Tax=Microbacterium sp. NPDC058345 TaxID=3346455 RepID=UPI003669120F